MIPTVATTRDTEPHGLRCIDCSTLVEPGDLITNRPVGMVHDHPLTEIVCWKCVTATTNPYEGDRHVDQ